jgi:hypothetical protein
VFGSKLIYRNLLAYPSTRHDIAQQINKVKETGIQHVFVISFSSYLERLLQEAVQAGITGEGYFWLLGMSTSCFDHVNVHPESPMAAAIQGFGVIPEFGAKPATPGYQRFVNCQCLEQTG